MTFYVPKGPLGRCAYEVDPDPCEGQVGAVLNDEDLLGGHLLGLLGGVLARLPLALLLLVRVLVGDLHFDLLILN